MVYGARSLLGQSDATKTEAVFEELNKIALKLDTFIAINTSHSNLTNSLNTNESDLENNNKNTSNASESN